jgi:SWI/SNF-related matrix-associated actin-dependent regulator of chromatin subfamily A-like protein 1
LVISYSLLIKPEVQKYLQQEKYQVIIMDEAHNIKTTEKQSKRSKASIKVAHMADVRILLSGTPFNYPSEMYNQIQAINPKIYPWYFNFGSGGADEPGKYFYATRYCKPFRTHFRNKDQWVFKGYDRTEELNTVFNSFLIRRRKHEILTQLPLKVRTVLTLDPLADKQQKQISKLLAQEKKEKADEKIVTQGSRDKYMESFRKTCEFKIVHVVNLLKDYLIDDIMVENPDMKIIIFMHHDTMRQALEELLISTDTTYFLINGETPAAKRQEYTEEFQTSMKYRVALLSIMAAGTGLTLTAASTVIFTEILFGPDQHLQAEDRAHRLGQQQQVNIFYLVEPKTTDDINYGLILKKERESSRILDGKANRLASKRVHVGDPSIISNLFTQKRSLPTVADEPEPETKRIRIQRPPKAPPKILGWDNSPQMSSPLE